MYTPRPSAAAAAESSAEKRFDVLHVAAGCWQTGGGLSEALAGLALAQARMGRRVALLFLDDRPEHPQVADCRAAGVEVFKLSRWIHDPFYFAPALITRLPQWIAKSACVHLHGFWSFPVWWAGRCARRAGVPFFLSPHGAFSAVAQRRGRLRKALYLAWGGRRLVAEAQRVCSASAREEADLRHLGVRAEALVRLPNGLNTAALDGVAAQKRASFVLFLGRLHPLKGLDLLLEAWGTAAPPPSWRLVIAGPADGYTLPPLPPGVEAIGACFGEEKVRLLKSAACLVCPSLSENFGLAVAEALYCRTPVIATQGTPWPQLGKFWVEPTVPALAEALKRIFTAEAGALEAHFAPIYAATQRAFRWEEILKESPLG